MAQLFIQSVGCRFHHCSCHAASAHHHTNHCGRSFSFQMFFHTLWELNFCYKLFNLGQFLGWFVWELLHVLLFCEVLFLLVLCLVLHFINKQPGFPTLIKETNQMGNPFSNRNKCIKATTETITFWRGNKSTKINFQKITRPGQTRSKACTNTCTDMPTQRMLTMVLYKLKMNMAAKLKP